MSDWTSSWSAFREGVGQMAAGRERRRQREIDDERLRLEKDRAAREQSASEIDLRLKNLRLNPPPMQAPEGFRESGFTVDEFGNRRPSYERIPDMFDPRKHTVQLADGSTAVLDPNTGKPVHFQKPDAWERFFGKRKQAGGEGTSPNTGVWRAPMKLPPPEEGSADGGAEPTAAVTGMNSDGSPRVELRYVATPWEMKSIPGPDGREAVYYERRNEKGEVETTQPASRTAPMSADTESQLNVALLAMDNLPNIYNIVQKAGDVGGPVSGKATAPLAWAFGPGEDRRAMQRLEAQTLVPLAKGILGETGALSEVEQKRYKGMLPNFEDTQQARREKYAELKRLVVDSARNRLALMKAKNQNTSAVEAEFSNKMAVIEAAERGAKMFKTEAEFAAAEARGEVAPGELVIVDGRVAKVD